ncbi:hypothetical protein JOD45_001761 [Scopulibacillus daqui]|uniref:WVELL protein n=1 Tax=Scopulibacillus daqui TaxID=1469162 RepID=A0ABS2Q0S3_9BACL|nr:YfhJ family protein [Scopulibacillus daqui]MBM7645550.1 hypothetical protein [Scopulibacillus daqui]
MNELFSKLAERLLEKNDKLTYDEAWTFVEILWEDFEVTRAKAGHSYVDKAVTEKIIRQWIDFYGPKFHDVIANHPKFKKLIKEKDFS